jgi:hypothetical protein
MHCNYSSTSCFILFYYNRYIIYIPPTPPLALAEGTAGNFDGALMTLTSMIREEAQSLLPLSSFLLTMEGGQSSSPRATTATGRMTPSTVGARWRWDIAAYKKACHMPLFLKLTQCGVPSQGNK